MYGTGLSDSEGKSSEIMLEDHRQVTCITMIVVVATVRITEEELYSEPPWVAPIFPSLWAE